MKKLLGILVLCLLINSNVYAEIVKFNCKSLNSQTIEWIKYDIDTSNNVFTQIFKHKNQNSESARPRILNVNGTTLTYDYPDWEGHIFEFNYGKNEFIDYQIKPERKGSIKCLREKLLTEQKPEEKKKKLEENQKETTEEEVFAEQKIDEIKNKNDLSNYLVQKGLVLKQTEDWIIDKWYDKVKEPIVYTFESNGTGNSFHMEDKSENNFIWKPLSKNTFNYKHPQSPYDPAIVTIDFKNNIASSDFYYGESKQKYEILYNFVDTQVEQAREEMWEEKKLIEERAKKLDDLFDENILINIMKLSKTCGILVRSQLDTRNIFTSIKNDIENVLYSAEESLANNNKRQMRIDTYRLRDLSHQAFSLSKTYSLSATTNEVCLTAYNYRK